MSKIILGFVGPMSSGKGTACEYLIKNYNASYYRYSTIVRDVLTRLGQEQTRANMQILSLSLRQLFGEDLFAKVMAKDVNKDKNKLICVDGIRRPEDIIYLSGIPGFHLISIDADEKIRYERIIKRSENPDDAKKTFAQFKIDQSKETETTIPSAMALAEIILDNSFGLNSLHGKLDKLIKEFQS